MIKQEVKGVDYLTTERKNIGSLKLKMLVANHSIETTYEIISFRNCCYVSVFFVQNGKLTLMFNYDRMI